MMNAHRRENPSGDTLGNVSNAIVQTVFCQCCAEETAIIRRIGAVVADKEVKHCKHDDAKVRKQLEDTKKFATAIDDQVCPQLDNFLPYDSFEQQDKGVANRFYFSNYLSVSVGEQFCVSWLRTYLQHGEWFSTILEDFAYLSVFLNDMRLILNLAFGILSFFDAFLENVNGAVKPETISVDTDSLLRQIGWTDRHCFVKDTVVLEKCCALLHLRALDFRKLLLQEQNQMRKTSVDRLLFNALNYALLAPVCIEADSVLSQFFVLFYTYLLPQNALLRYNDDFKRLSRRKYGSKKCRQLTAQFAEHPRIALLSDAERAKKLQKRLLCTEHLPRGLIEKERVMVASMVQCLRGHLLKFLNNFLCHAKKLLVMLHISPVSLIVLNTFRLHILAQPADCVEKCMLFSYEAMSKSPMKRAENDPPVMCAPYCFHCSAYMHQLWPSEFPHVQLKNTPSVPQNKQTFLCRCNTARYCSERCADLHWPEHQLFCPAARKADSLARANKRQTGITKLRCRTVQEPSSHPPGREHQ